LLRESAKHDGVLKITSLAGRFRLRFCPLSTAEEFMRNPMRASWIVFVCMTSSLLPRLAVAQNNTERGAVLGGVSGALLGAGIGKHNDETAVGALVGGAVGLLAGSTIGNSMDRTQQQAWARQQYRQQVIHQQQSRAVSMYDVVSMSQSGLSPDVIINQIHQYGVQRAPSVQEVITLHQQGVHNSVIAAMQQAGGSSAVAAPPTTVIREPVVVEQYHYVAPPRYHYYGPRYHHYHHHYQRPHPRSGVSYGVTVHH
jgi:hypothetical protein